MSKNRFYKIDVDKKDVTFVQDVLCRTSQYGLWRNLIGDDYLTLHQIAGRIKHFVENNRTSYEMPTEKELGFGLLRLYEEGLIGMTFTDRSKRPVGFVRLHESARLPTYAHSTDAGLDLYSVQALEIPAGETRLVSLGFAANIPEGFEFQIRSRSSLAAKHSVSVLNSPGTIDSGYRGEWKVILHNFGKETFVVNVGDRIAQAVFSRVDSCDFVEGAELEKTDRGEGGFGSTGR